MTLLKCMYVKNNLLIPAGKFAADLVKQTSSGEKVSLIARILNLVRHIGSASGKVLNQKKLPFVGALKLVGLGVVPFVIYDIGTVIFSKKSCTTNEKADAALKVISTAGTLGDITTTTAEGLVAVGAVAARAIRWVNPVIIVSGVLESVGMLFTAKCLTEIHFFSKIFNRTAALEKPVQEYTLEDFSKTRKIIELRSQEKSFVAKHFNTSSEKMNSRLIAIENEAKALLASEDSNEMLKVKEKLQTTMQALSKRMKVNTGLNALSLLSGTVSLIGLPLVFSPAIPVGFAFMAIGGVLSLVNFFAEKIKTSQFENELGMS